MFSNHNTPARVQRICQQCGLQFEAIPSRVANGRAKYCSRVCANLHRSNKDSALLDRRAIDPVSLCWNWTGTLDKRGYGVIQFQGRQRFVHRLSVEHHHGLALSALQFVCHRCDNPRCFNPDHLFISDAVGNMVDRDSKQRQAQGSRIAHAKLSESLVREIRMRRDSGESGVALAKDYQVSDDTIYEICARHTWKHVD